jgi:hypothetical protein
LDWPILWRYTLATLAVYIVMRFFAFLPNKATIYIILGATSFVLELLPKHLTPDIQRPGAPSFAAASLLSPDYPEVSSTVVTPAQAGAQITVQHGCR